MGPDPKTSLRTHPEWVPLARFLRATGGGASTASAVSTAIGRDRSNTRRTLDRLVAAGIAERVPCDRPPRQRGRAPQHAYVLSKRGEAELLDLSVGGLEPGVIAPGTQVVFAEAAAENLLRLADVFTDPVLISQLAWAALVDGDRQEYAFVFDGPEAADRALTLTTALASAGIRARRATTVRIWSGTQVPRHGEVLARAGRRGGSGARSGSAPG